MIPSDIKKLLLHLEENGVKGYIVGGAVRDILINKVPEDYDIAAECTPEDLCRIFDGFKSFDNGIRFGTLSVFSGERYVEITCCRRESGYSDLRRPDKVEYCRSIKEDLARRDFTVNAIAMDKDGRITDPFGGREAIENKVICTVGEPQVRFDEDALRIIRALRFASSLGFRIDRNTSDAIRNCKDQLLSVSGERIFAELKKLLLGDFVFSVLMEYSSEICTVIPALLQTVGFEQNNPHHIYTVYEHTARAVAASPKDVNIRLCMLFHDIAKPSLYTVDSGGIGHFYGHPELSAEIAQNILKGLRADGETVSKVCSLIKYHDLRPKATRKSLMKYISKVGFESALELIEVRRADLSAQSPEFFYQFEYLSQSEMMIKELQKEGVCIKVSDLAVDGNDLIHAGVPKGREIGEMLSYLLSKVIGEECENSKEELLKLVKKKRK